MKLRFTLTQTARPSLWSVCLGFLFVTFCMLQSYASHQTALELLKQEAKAERASLLASAAAVRESVQQQAFVAAAAHQRTADLTKQQHEAQIAQVCSL